jgi:hypothetical protein
MQPSTAQRNVLSVVKRVAGKEITLFFLVASGVPVHCRVCAGDIVCVFLGLVFFRAKYCRRATAF